MESLKEFSHAGKNVSIGYDECPMNPRDDQNGTIILAWIRSIGDKRISRMTESEVIESYADSDPALAIKPLYMLDHSGIALSTSPFGCSFDSGQVGWIVITQSTADACGFSAEAYDTVMNEELKVLQNYINGNVYAYTIADDDGEIVDSCAGFGSLEECEGEATRAALAA